MIIIGAEQSPEERIRLDTDDVDAVTYYAKNVTAVSVKDALGVRVPDYVDWPTLQLTPEDAVGYYVYGATWDSRYLDIDYPNRRVKLKKVGATSVSFQVENADGSVIDVVWNLDILDKLTALSVTLDPSQDESHDIFTALRLTANLDGGDYPYTFKWYLDNNLFRTRATDPNNPNDKTDSVNIGSLQWKDEGTYRVDAIDRNGVLSSSSTFKLTIIPQAIVIDGVDETFRVQQGSPWSDTFTFVGGKPQFAFQWFHDNAPTLYTNQTILIPSVQPSDAGDYTLQITDALGTVAMSPAAYTLYVMEYYIKATVRSVAAGEVSTITNNGRKITAMLDVNDPREISYNLAGVRFDNGAAVTVGPWSDDYTGSALSTGTIGTDSKTLELKPLAPGSATFKIYTDDNKSDALDVVATVVAKPHIDAAISLPSLVYVSSMATQPTEQITPDVRSSAVSETYKWERKLPGGAWTTIATTKTLAYTPLTSVSQDGALYRFSVINQYATAVSNEVAAQFMTFDGIGIARQDVNVNDPLVPGGVYPVTVNGATVPQQRALALPTTSSAYALQAANADVTVTKGTGHTATVTVDTLAPASSNVLELTLTNTNGTPDATYKTTRAMNVVEPTITTTRSTTALVDIEIPVADLDISDAFKRGPDFRVVFEPTDATAATSDFRGNTLYVTGKKIMDSMPGFIVVYYNAPGVTAVQHRRIQFNMSVRKKLTLQAGLSTSGDRTQAYVDSQNKIK